MVVPVPMRRHRDEPQLQVGYRYREAGVLESSRDLVELVEPWKAQLGRALRMPCRHHRDSPVNAQDCEVRPARLQGAKETSRVAREILQQVEDLVAKRHIEVAPLIRHGVGNLEGEGPVSGETGGVCDGTEAGSYP